MESDFIKSVSIEPFTGTDDQYHALEGYISVSKLKKMKVSPAHFKEAEEDEETAAMIFGSAYHCYVLEPERFEKEYYVFDDSAIYQVLIGEGFKSPRSTKEYKAWQESEMRVIGERKVIEKDLFNMIKTMRDKLMRHPYVKMLLSGGVKEQGYYGIIQTMAGPIKIKFKPDQTIERKKLCIDLKTTVDASADGFPRHAADLDYHLQGALYSDLLEKISGDNRPWTFFFIAQEKKRPFAFNVFEASPQFIAQGRYEFEMLLQLYKHCVDNDSWPGYQVWCENRYGIIELRLPPYQIKSLDYYIYSSPVVKPVELASINI